MVLVPLWLSVLVGCGEDPVLEAARLEAGPQGVSVDEREPGRPEEPEPGVPDEAPPRAGGPGTILPDGPSVIARGRVAGPEGGEIVIDVFDADHSKGGADLVGRIRLAAPGPFELQVPEDSQVWISAWMDADGDGKPSHGEPTGQAKNPVSTGAGVQDLVLALE